MPTNTFSKSFFLEDGPGAQLRFAGPRATSNWVVLPVIFVLSFNASSVTDHDTLEIFLLRVVADISAFVAAWLVFMGFGALINRVLHEYGYPRMIALILLYACTEMCRTSTGYFVTVGFGIPEDPDWAYRLTAAAMTGIVLFGIASTLVNDSAMYRSAYRELLMARLRLEATVSTSQSALAAIRDRMVARIREQLGEALRSSLDESARKNPQLSVMTENLFSAVEGVVRPVSRELFGVPPAFEDSGVSISPPRLKFALVIDAATMDRPIKPLAFSTVALLLSAPTIVFKIDIGFSTIQFLVATVLIFLTLYVCEHAFNPLMRSSPLWVRGALLTLAYWLGAYVAMVAAGITSDPSRSPLLIIYGLCLGGLMGWLFAIITGMHGTRISMLHELSEKNLELAWVNARMQSELWSEQKRLAMSLHNNVQGMLLAAALKLRVAAESSAQTQDLTEVRSLVQKAIDFEFTSNEKITLSKVIEALENSWGELIEVSVITDSKTATLINADQILVRTLNDVLSEFTTNAIKHGSAKSVSVRIQQLDDRNIHVELLNDGKPQRAGATEGMGTAFMKSVAVSSSILALPTGFGITLVLPVEAEDVPAMSEIDATTRA